MASKSDKRKKKKKQSGASSSSTPHNAKANGSRPGLIFNSCVNCEIPLDNGTTKVAEFMLSFSESKRTFSVLEALTSVFELSTDLDQDIFPILTTKNLVMCPQCATVLASLYKSYVELMQMSKGSANICKLIRKAEVWHEKKGDLILNSSEATTANNDEEDEEEEEEEDEENSESDSDAEYDKKVSSMLKGASKARNGSSASKKRTRVKKEPHSPVSTPTPRKVGRPSNAQKGKTPKKIAKANNGDSYEMSYDESDPEEDDDEDYGKKRKTPSKATGDRGRTRQRNSTTSSGRRRIRRRPSQTRDDDYKCQECDRTFKFECRLIKHLQTHDTEKRLPCTMCDKSFIYSWMLENHVLGDHQKQVPDECQICGLTFFREEIFKNHFCTPKDQQEAEREIRGHWCRLCGKGFSKLAHLTLHLRSHEEDKPLRCPSCSLRFKYEKCLQKHMTVHEKDYPCPSCDQMFSHKSKLRSHVQSQHSKKTPKSSKKSPVVKDGTPRSEGKNNCPNCNRSFGRKNDMMRHLKKKICFSKVDVDVTEGRPKSPAPFPDGYESADEYYPRPSSDEDEDVSDVDSMSPGVSNSEDENHSLPSSPSSPVPHRNLDLSEESSNSPVASPKPSVPDDANETALPIKVEAEVKEEIDDFRKILD